MTVSSRLARVQSRFLGYGVSWAQLAWFGHRLSGIGVLVYLFMHIVENAMLLVGPDAYNATMDFFHNPIIRAGEVVLMAALVYHALNGLKVILIDLVPAATVWYRPLTQGVIVATVVAMVPLAAIMFAPFAPWW